MNKNHDKKPGDKNSKKENEKKKHDDEMVDESSEESFPASDPPSWVNHDKDK